VSHISSVSQYFCYILQTVATSFQAIIIYYVNKNIPLYLLYVLDDDEVNDDLLGTKLILVCDAPSGKMNFSLNSVFVRPLAAAQTFMTNDQQICH